MKCVSESANSWLIMVSCATSRMFALLDLAFQDSRACPGGGYTSVSGRYSKRHMLLMQHLIDTDAGDPFFYSTDPFAMIHKLITRPAYVLSTKHEATVAGSILRKVCFVCRCTSSSNANLASALT